MVAALAVFSVRPFCTAANAAVQALKKSVARGIGMPDTMHSYLPLPRAPRADSPIGRGDAVRANLNGKGSSTQGSKSDSFFAWGACGMHVMMPVVLAVLLVAWHSSAGEQHGSAAWRDIADIRDPNSADGRMPAPVRIRGRVTWVTHDDMMNGYAAVQDATAGIWVNCRLARQRGLWNPEQEESFEAAWLALAPGIDVIIEGVRDTEGFAPMLLPIRAWCVVPSVPELPPAAKADPRRLFSGADDSQRVTVEGILQGSRDDGVRWTLVLEADRQRIFASVPREWLTPGPADLVDGVVRLSGVAASLFTTRGEFMSPFFQVCRPEDVTIVAPPPCAAFDAPLIALSRLGRFRVDPPSGHRVRCVGTLSHYRPGDCLYIQEQAVGLRVGLAADSEFACGDVVEVSGFVDSSPVVAGVAEAAVMTGAVARKLRSGKPPSPIPIVPADIVRANAAARAAGLVAEPGDFDGVLVTFPARLVEAQQTDDGGELVLASDDLTLHALAGPAEYPALRLIEIGSQLQVTGVLQMHLSEMRSRSLDWQRPLVQRMGVLLRSADDVAVVGRPTWWNRRRLAAALSLVAVGLSLALAWIWSLRMEVAAQSRRIREEMRGRREAAVEYRATLRERNRLAANLHDTLLQSLSALGIQLQSCELSGRSGSQDLGRNLGLARTMVDDAVAELRGSVWSLRSIPLKEKSFAEAVESLGRHVMASTAIDVATRIDPATPPVPGFVAGNLLLVLQEAMHNAVRHAEPHAIRIAITPGTAAGSVALTISDDGRGFTPGRQAGPEEGHFGLSVMRERIERLGGRLELESGPGGGTTIHITITPSPHDVDFEAV